MLKSIASGVLSRRPLSKTPNVDALLCFSHLRWDFVYQRPQHLMTRFSLESRVYYIEEPMFGAESPRFDLSRREGSLTVVVPWLPHDLSESERNAALAALIDEMIVREPISTFVAWYYTPMMLPWTRQLEAVAVIYDCMDELSLFRGAPAEMLERERELIDRADIVFTGGTSLYEAKRSRTSNVHCFPSSVDAAHFAQARLAGADPDDQSNIPHPRLGFAGVIDERMDIELLRTLATLRPDWHLVLLGPVVKIDPASLPQLPNIHYLGPKPYADLPRYLSGWDAGLLPFALNESTRFISPTKTPEYLAAGLPVVSTPIRDVVAPYAVAELVAIGMTGEDFVNAVEALMARAPSEARRWLTRVDDFLSTMSWDRTFTRMSKVIAQAITNDQEARASRASHAPARRLASALPKRDVAMET